MFWSAGVLLLTLFVSVLNTADNPVLHFISGALGQLSMLAIVSLILGGWTYFFKPQSEGESNTGSKGKFWAGLILILLGLGFPAWIVYYMLTAPGAGDAIFIVMIIGPFGLVMAVGGLVLMIRNRPRR